MTVKLTFLGHTVTKELPKNMCVESLLKIMSLPKRVFIIYLNGETSSRWTVLEEGDHVELKRP